MFNQQAQLTKYLEQLSRGNLDVTIDPKLLRAGGSIGASARYLQAIINNLRENTQMLNDASNGTFEKVKPRQGSTNKINAAVDNVTQSLKALYDKANYVEDHIYKGLSDTGAMSAKLSGSFSRIDRSIETLMDRVYQFETVLDNLPWLITITDANENWNFVNKTGLEFLNVKREEIIGTKCDNASIAYAHEKFRNGEKEIFMDTKGLSIQVNMSSVKDRNDKEVGIATFSQVITERANTEKFEKAEVQRIYKNLMKLADGDFSFDMEVSDLNVPQRVKDMFLNINSGFKKASDIIHNLVDEIRSISQNFEQGNIRYRADETGFEGAYKAIVSGINSTLNIICSPFDAATQCMHQISMGIMPKLSDTEYKGEIKEMKDSMNGCISAIENVIADISAIIDAVKEGDLSFRPDPERHSGEFRRIVKGINMILDIIDKPFVEVLTVLESVSQGDLSIQVKGDYKGKIEELKISLNNTINILRSYITEISTVLNEMAHRNLDLTLKADYKGDFVQIGDALTTIINYYNNLIANVKLAANQVSVGSEQISQGSQSLSQGATEQASAIEELTATMSEILEHTKQNAENAKVAKQKVSEVQERTKIGSEKMAEMVDSMNKIHDESANISKIIKVIDDIAFQTNILALNAAVEAARAGQYGKGFAVVAEEVRNLAAKSAEAAKNTTKLIEDSFESVQNGTKIASEMDTILGEISRSVDETTTLVMDIASSSDNGAQMLKQVDSNILDVSKVVQMNSATAEESAASTEELSSQAQALEQLVSDFKVKKMQ